MILRIVLTVMVCLVAAGAAAQNLKPGLWEVSHKMKSSSGEMERGMAQMQQQLAGMPPEQRRMVEEMMAKQGVGMPGKGAAGMASRFCMTQEMAARNDLPAERGDCKATKQERRGNTIHIAYQCSNPPSSGEGQYTVLSPEAYTMQMTVRTTVQGRNETMNMDGSGRWIGADCGNLTPRK